MEKKYQWAIRNVRHNSYATNRSNKYPGSGFLYSPELDDALLFVTAADAAARLAGRLEEQWDPFELVPVRLIEVTETKRSLI